MAFKKDKNVGGTRYANRQIGLTTQDDNSARSIGAPNIEFYELETAEVVDIILNDSHPSFTNYSDIGKAKIRFVHSESGRNESLLSWAKPIDVNMKSYPVKHELVIAITFYGNLYYTHKLNIFNNPNNNAYPGASLPDLSREYKNKRKANEYEEASINPNKKNKAGEVILGNTFKSTIVKPVAVIEGDVILEGRFGQSIKFGSNPETQFPNLKIKVGEPDDIPEEKIQPIEENINEDPNAIWISSTEEIIGLNPATIQSPIHLQFYDDNPDEFTGNQIFMNSDRIVFNTKQNEFMTFAKRAINLVTEGIFTVDSEKDLILNTNGSTIFNSPYIYLGSADAVEPVVLGETLKTLLEELIDLIINHKHPTGTGPSGPTLPPEQAQINQIKNKLESILSKQNFSV